MSKSPVRFVPIEPGRIPFEWVAIERLIGKAIAHDKGATATDVYHWLVSGKSGAAWVATDKANGVLVTTIGMIDGASVCWLNYIGGTVEGGPKGFVAEARRIVGRLEELALDAGCTELRDGGRNWSRVFPDWERFDPEHPNRIRKALQ